MTFARSTIWLWGVLALAACSRDDHKASQVTIAFPNVPQSYNQKADPLLGASFLLQSLSPSWNIAVPSSLSDVDCYAVFIGANEPGLRESYCTNESQQILMNFGLSAGLFAKGNSASLKVKSGPARTISIAGLKKLTGTCESGLNKLTHINYSFPYLLASKTIDLAPGDVAVDMVLQGTFNSQTKMSECSFFGSGSNSNSGVQKIASAYNHTCVLLPNSQIKCWGDNTSGQLGLGDTSHRGDGPGEMGANLPYVDLGESAVQIGVGAQHSCALSTSGRVKCWGGNAFGQLGLGDTQNRGDGAGEMGANLPYVDLGIGRLAVKIAVGNYFTCALLDNSTVKCWGVNTSGHLGLGDTNHRGDGPGEMGDNLPALSLTASPPQKIFAGVNNACALLADESLYCWGDGANGAVGDGTAGSNRLSPVLVSGFGTGSGVIDVEIGYLFSCAVLNTGNVKCWGDNGFGQLGDNTTVQKTSPVAVVGMGGSALKVVLGNQHACALMADASMKCWGFNGNGSLGLENSVDQWTPQSVIAISGVSGMALGASHTCATLTSGQVKCWGQNTAGQLGLGDTATRGHSTSSMTNLPLSDLLGP